MSRLLNLRTPGSIIVGVDDSAPSRAAITWAMHRGALAEVEVVLVHVISEDEATASRRALGPGTSRSGLAFLEAELDFARLIDPKVSVKTELLSGDPLDQLAGASQQRAMLVIGTHKTGFVHGRVFGSRFIELARLASSPVVFIPNSASQRRSGVVVGVGSVDQDEQIIQFAAREADRSGQELVILHGRQAGTVEADRRSSATQLDTVSEAAEVMVRRVYPSLVIRRRTVDRAPAEALVDSSMSAALLVIGRSRRTTQHPGSVGATVHDVLLNLAGPTVIVHDVDLLSRTSSVGHAAPMY